MKPVRLTKRAETEIERAASWYEKHSEGLGEKFLEDTTTKWIAPKSGNYGQTWWFTIAGTKRVIKARSPAKDVLTKYSDGMIRFYQGTGSRCGF